MLFKFQQKTINRKSLFFFGPVVFLMILFCTIGFGEETTDENCNSTRAEINEINSEKSADSFIHNLFYPQQIVNRGRVLSGDYLSGNAKTIYDFLVEKIDRISKGLETDTEFFINIDNCCTVYYADKSGIITFGENGRLSDDGINAINEAIHSEVKSAVEAVKSDYVEKMFWVGNYYEWNIDWNAVLNESGTIASTTYVRIDLKLYVGSEYRLNENELKFNSNLIHAADNAVSFSKQIIASCAGKTDMEKLRTYKEKICSMVEYDHSAWGLRDDGTTGILTDLGSPWQIVWVFDNDPETNVVCEGYAKAFKYLCEISNFNSDISVICVDGGGHMWNVVNMDDGQNYLADITWCDSGSDLFLVGYTSGSYDTAYNFLRGEDEWYTYTYNASCKQRYSRNQLELCNHDYNDIVVSEIKLDCTELSLSPGDTFSLSATISPDNATNKAITWTTSDNSVATVNESGLVTAVGNGDATITAAAMDGGGATAVCSVTVVSSVPNGTIVSPLKSLTVTSGFIPNRTLNEWTHLSTDYRAAEGESVMAIADGTVKRAEYNSVGGYMVDLEHKINGVTCWSRYQHFCKAAIVSVGQKVSAGQVIGYAGNTGSGSQGTHLHIQVFSGNYVSYLEWGRSNFSQYPADQVVNGPVVYNGTTYYNPHRILTGLDTIGLPEIPKISADATAPTSLSNGSSFWLKGTISCKYTMTEVRGRIYNCTTGNKIFDIPVTPNSTSYALGTTGEKINDGLIFGDSRLNNSWCRYELIVTYNKNGTSYIRRLFDRYFTVGSATAITLQQPGVFGFICDDETRSGPAEANSLVRSCSQGTIVFATGYELNNSRNMWLKLTDGSYVWSGDVNRITFEETPISETYCFSEDGNSKVYPYEESPNYASYEEGDSVAVVAQITNTRGEVWYKLSDDSWVSSDTGINDPSIILVDGIALNQVELSLDPGDTFSLTATVSPDNATKKTISWTTSDNSVATVNESGLVTAVAPGKATITASATDKSGQTAVCNITVNPIDYTFEFRDVVYPKTFRINTTNGWFLQGGTLVSDVGLTSIRSVITRASDGEIINGGDTGEIPITSGKTFNQFYKLSPFDQKIKFSNITTAGDYIWKLIAKDENGRTLTMEMPFAAVSSGSTVTDTTGTAYPMFVPVSEIVFTKMTDLENDDHIGASAIYGVQVLPANATNKELAFSIDDELVASLSNITPVSDPASVGNDYFITLHNMGIGTATLTAASTDDSDVSTQIPVTIETNITDAEYYAYKSVDGENLDLHSIQLEAGDVFCVGVNWWWSYEPDAYDYQFVLEETSGLEAQDDDSRHTGWFIAQEPGTWYIYLDFFENDQLILDVNQTYEIHVSCVHTSTEWQETKAPTCTETGEAQLICDVCGEVLDTQTIAALGHTEAINEAIDPTCTEPGLSEGKHCSVCNEVLEAQQPVPALGHEEVTDAAVAATCTETGLTEGKHCERCNSILVAQQTVPALGHEEVTDAAVAATCTETGLTEGKHCERCNSILVAQQTVPTLGHKEVTDAAVAATCTATGLTEGKHCSRCDAVLVAQNVVPALGHEEVTDAAVAATCTKTGLTEGKHCSRCDTVLVTQNVVPALGHEEVTDAAVTATCTETGLTAGSHCERCGTVLNKQETIPPTGHEYAYYAEEKPTCTEPGITEGFCCKNCGMVITGRDAIPAAGHCIVVDEAVEPTCTAVGWTEGTHCSVCGLVMKEQESIPMVAHQNVMDASVMPTCTTEGLTAGFHCRICGTVFVEQQKIAALGHDWGETSYTWTPDNLTVTAQHVCNRNDNHVETEQVSATAEIIAPTDTAQGYVIYSSRTFKNTDFEVQTKTIIIPALNQMKTLKLPSALKQIESEAFSNLTCQAVIIPDGCVSIGSRAFADCKNLIYVRIPASVTSVAEDAFAGCDQIIIDRVTR